MAVKHYVIAEYLGIGIDDMFVISQCWSNMKKDPCNTKLSLPDQMGVTLKHAGVSITITTVTDVFAFGVGAFSVSFFACGYTLSTYFESFKHMCS